MSDVNVRTAMAVDERALADLDRRVWSTVHAISPRPEPDSPFFDVAHLPGDYLVAERLGRVVGYLRLVHAIPLLSNSHVRTIQGLAVDHAERGRGIGRLLLEAACEQARRQGARRITLRVLAGNTPARRLYESAGFRVEGVFPGEFYLDGQYVDDIAMGRPL